MAADWVVAIGVSCVGGLVCWGWDGTLTGVNFYAWVSFVFWRAVDWGVGVWATFVTPWG
jgi:hypothetical protein